MNHDKWASQSCLNNLSSFSSITHVDSRGLFRSIYKSTDENFRHIWGERPISQVNLSFNKKAGQIRGLHYQSFPNCEAKLVVCIRGRVWDVAVDMRSDSSTRHKWRSFVLDSTSLNTILIPEGFAHGFQALDSNSEILYLHSGDWIRTSEAGVRFDDPQLSISWPLPPVEVSNRDLALPFIDLCL